MSKCRGHRGSFAYLDWSGVGRGPTRSSLVTAQTARVSLNLVTPTLRTSTLNFYQTKWTHICFSPSAFYSVWSAPAWHGWEASEPFSSCSGTCLCDRQASHGSATRHLSPELTLLGALIGQSGFDIWCGECAPARPGSVLLPHRSRGVCGRAV